MNKGFEEAIHSKEIQMANKHEKTYLFLLSIRQVQIKPMILSFHTHQTGKDLCLLIPTFGKDVEK